ncbi:MAG: sodium-dependent bicarbonate transport family permease [Elainella sp. Prado103]|nr:sodium-dependent bicarbonate transport family permease [Elainella sp. Prado103]
MNASLILSNILNPPVLFFFLGMLAIFVRSDLEIPAPLPKLFSLYLLFAIGFKGGVELVKSGINQEVVLTILAAVLMACAVPLYTFFILRWKLDAYNAAAIAATYGSISAVTFITAGSFLQQLEIAFDGYMVAALALMESPAIIVGLVLVKLFTAPQKKHAAELGSEGTGVDDAEAFNWSEVLREAFLNSSVFLLVGSLLVGILTGEHGWETLKPFAQDLFYGVLTFFLLDMGLVAAKRIKDLRKTGIFLIAFAILIPMLNAAIGLGLAYLIGMSQGDALLFCVLCASASYIAVPAAMRLTVPEANPSLYVSAALAVTFPFNIILGIPLYLYGVNLLWY